MRVRFMLFSIERANKVNRHFVWIGEKLSGLFFNVKYSLQQADLEISPEKYLTAAFFSALVYGLLFFALVFALTLVRDQAVTMESTIISLVIGIVFFAIFLFLHVIYPGIMAKKYASGIDQNLLFSLKSMLIQVSSGVSLFKAMVNVSKANYGFVSKEFGELAKEISAGESEAKALEKMALKTKSDYLRRVAWQLLASLRSGASVQGALQSIVQTLTNRQVRAIKDYAAELNLWILVYLLLAAAVPTLGITFLVILSAMGGASVGPELVLVAVFGAFVMQVALIGFVKNRMPRVFA
jgi:pilus assembly protein TadC